MNTISTPWGASQHSKHLGEGITIHSCANHGGIYVPKVKLLEMPEALRCNCYAGGGSWFEEDCEWALVALAFPHLFTPYNVLMALKTIRNAGQPYTLAALWLNTPAAENVVALAEDFLSENAKKYTNGSMSGDQSGWRVWASTLDGSHRIIYRMKDYPKLPTLFTLAELEAAGGVIQPSKEAVA